MKYTNLGVWLLDYYFLILKQYLNYQEIFICRYTNKVILILYGKIQSNVLWKEVDHVYSKYFNK